MLSSAARAMCAGGRAARDADDGAARVRIPVRRAEAGERRHEVHAAVVGDAAPRAARSSAAVRIRPRPSRSHCTTAPPMNTLPSSAYSVRAADLPRDGRDQLVPRERRRRADVLQQEAAGAVGVLRHARLTAHLAEQRRLLIAGDAGDRHVRRARATSRRRRRPRSTTAPRAACARGMSKQAQQLVVPVAACGC